MELIVKIGADQQGLQDVVNRLKEQFKSMNTSAPAGWSPHMAGMNQYGTIMQSAGASGGFASQLSGVPIIGDLASKFSSMIGPIGLVSAALGGLGLMIHQVGDTISKAGQDMRIGRITGMSGLMARRWRQAGEAAGIEDGAGTGMVNRLNAQVGGFNAGDSAAQKLFGELGIDPSGMSTDDLLVAIKSRMGGMKDPAARARLAKGLFGRGGFEVTELMSKLEPPGLADTEGADLGAASGIKKWWRSMWRSVGDAREMLLTKFAGMLAKSNLAHFLGITPGKELASGIAGEEFQDVINLEDDSETAAQRDARHRHWAAGASKIKKEKALREEKSISFQSDALAQAGLFAGSSLLFNPNFSIQQQQLDALVEIKGNTARMVEGTFS